MPTKRLAAFWALLKPRVMSLVIFSACVGMLLAPLHTSPLVAFFALLCIALGAGASGALNMAYEADIDEKMKRTQKRPIPSGRVKAQEAFLFGITLSMIAVMSLILLTNLLAGALLAFTIFFYAVIYTMWLKPNTPQNIVIGGAAGALPPVIGWVAVSGSLSWHPILVFLIIFIWTPSHFWALALKQVEDYRAAKIPMLPVVVGPEKTKESILIYALLLLITSFLPFLLGYQSVLYIFPTLLLGLGYVYYSHRLYTNDRYAMPLFGYSIFYLFGILLVMVLDRLFM